MRQSIMRKRRTNKEIERAVFDALREVAKEVGLSAFTLSQVANKAGVDMKVIRRRYPTERDLMEAYAAQMDRRVSELYAVSESKDLLTKYRHLFHAYKTLLDEDEDYRDLLLWELADTSGNALESSERREAHILKLMEKDLPRRPIGDLSEKLRVRMIIYIAGITYLSLYKEGQTFLGIDHRSRERVEEIEQIWVGLLESYIESLS